MNTIKCMILGVDDENRLLKRVLETVYNPVFEEVTGNRLEVIGFFTERKGDPHPDDFVIPLSEIGNAYETGVRMFILPKKDFVGQSGVVSAFLQTGIPFETVCIASAVRKETLQPDHILSLLTPYDSSKYLPYLEYHIADHCNLNCMACEHYSGLVKEDVFPDFEALKKDLTRLTQFIDDIGIIRILGGEPLLNPDICDYLDLTRQLYPEAGLCVVTNGIRLFSISEDFFEAVRRNNALIYVSFYPPLKDRRGDLEELLGRQNAPHLITDLNTVFTKKQVLERHDSPAEAFSHCFQARCHNVYDGKIAACFLPFTTKYFNDYFGKALPEDGAIDLYDPELTTESLKKKLLTPFERCRYCSEPVPVDWDVMHTPSVLSDWVKDAETIP